MKLVSCAAVANPTGLPVSRLHHGIVLLRPSPIRLLNLDDAGLVQWRARYGLEHGAAFGLSHGLGQLSVFRPSIRDDKVRGLYFVGASTRPGNGVPLCMTSAALADEHISADWSPGTAVEAAAA